MPGSDKCFEADSVMRVYHRARWLRAGLSADVAPALRPESKEWKACQQQDRRVPDVGNSKQKGRKAERQEEQTDSPSEKMLTSDY